MLEGKNVNLRVVEKEDLPQLAEWINDPDFYGEYEPLIQVTRVELEKQYDNLLSEERWFIVEKKDGSSIGGMSHFPEGKLIEIGYTLIPGERGKSYCTEAVKLMIDYLFLSKNIIRVQAPTDPRNISSQRVLEKAGFKKEAIVRKSNVIRGKWRDRALYSILRKEWKEPKILTKTASG
ncbi:MAG: GNAT family N-acetyltransferase [Candidatus Bathyarchaeota archaeon]|nr:GNAT family N-acetyltransferase [Candidatus Bathyarchaeota archaeon]